MLNDLKSHGNGILIISDKNNFNKQTDRVATFENDTSEHRSVSPNPASTMMLGGVTSNGEKMPPGWFEQGYRLTSAVYREVLEAKVFS